MRARRHLDAERCFDRPRKGKRVGHSAVAGGAAGELAPRDRRGARHQPFDALVHVAEPFLQPHDRFAIGGEAEMAGLDDAGMHRADRDLVQALALDGQEGVGRARDAAAIARRADA